MARRNVLLGALRIFLGTFTSRNGDLDGYWIFGWVVGNVESLEIDLLQPAQAKRAQVVESRPTVMATMMTALRMVRPTSRPAQSQLEELAIRLFSEQNTKAGARLNSIQSAVLQMSRLDSVVTRRVVDKIRSGYEVQVRVLAVDTAGRQLDCKKTIFVAPHDDRLERRSVRGK